MGLAMTMTAWGDATTAISQTTILLSTTARGSVATCTYVIDAQPFDSPIIRRREGVLESGGPMGHYRRTTIRRRRAAIRRILAEWNVRPWRPPVINRNSITIMVAGAEITVPISTETLAPRPRS